MLWTLDDVTVDLSSQDTGKMASFILNQGLAPSKNNDTVIYHGDDITVIISFWHYRSTQWQSLLISDYVFLTKLASYDFPFVHWINF